MNPQNIKNRDNNKTDTDDELSDHMQLDNLAFEIDAFIKERHSVRAYLPKRVEKKLIQTVLRTARSAPSGANLQPGKFHVLTGASLLELVNALQEAHKCDRPIVEEYSYFPKPMPAHLKARQRAAGYALYESLNIGRRDIEKRKAQFARNYAFFDAPVGIVVTIERAMGKGCFMDLGNTLMTLLLSAKAHGLSTSGLGALANYADLVHSVLNLPADEMVVCGIAMGYCDESAPENNVKTTRIELEEYTSFRGFD